jgi:hypothetical protein
VSLYSRTHEPAALIDGANGHFDRAPVGLLLEHVGGDVAGVLPGDRELGIAPARLVGDLARVAGRRRRVADHSQLGQRLEEQLLPRAWELFAVSR